MPDDEPPFEVEVYAGGAPPIRFQITPDVLRHHRHPVISTTAAKDGRIGLARAAVGMLAWVFDRSKDTGDPVEVTDLDGGYWMIAPSSIMAIRFFDPLDKTGDREFGFRPRSQPL